MTAPLRHAAMVGLSISMGVFLPGCTETTGGGATTPRAQTQAGGQATCRAGFTFTQEGNQCIRELDAGPGNSCPRGGEYSGLTGTCVIYQG